MVLVNSPTQKVNALTSRLEHLNDRHKRSWVCMLCVLACAAGIVVKGSQKVIQIWWQLC